MKQLPDIGRLLWIGSLGTIIIASCLLSSLPKENSGTQQKINSFAQTVTARSAIQTENQHSVGLASIQATKSSQELSTNAQELELNDTFPIQATGALPLLKELTNYLVEPDSGKVGWIHPPIRVQSSEINQAVFQNEFPNIIAKDFVIAADITWESSSSSSGCGFSLRAQYSGAHLDHYLVIITRLEYGYVLFSTMNEGKPVNLREIYLDGLDPQFAWENGSTNRLAVVVKDHDLTIYTNFTKLGTIDVTKPPTSHPNLPPTPQSPGSEASIQALTEYAQLERSFQDMSRTLEQRYQEIFQNYTQLDTLFTEGFAGLVAVNGTGTTLCEFNNAWLWLMDP